MIFTKTPAYLQKSFPKILWKGADSKAIYLTFDDGPTPEVTDYVLSILKEYSAKATFFCIGNRVKQFPELYQRTIDEGHSMGNHTHTHPHGWRTSTNVYLAEVAEAATQIHSNLFRPPYGELSWSQYQSLKEDYQIVMWDVVSWDFQAEIKADDCYNRVVKHTTGGSIIVYHDKTSCFEILQDNLPRLMQHYTREGFSFKAIPMGESSSQLGA